MSGLGLAVEVPQFVERLAEQMWARDSRFVALVLAPYHHAPHRHHVLVALGIWTFSDRREWRHFEWVFRNWFGFLYDTAEEWLDQAANAPGELGEAVPDRRETDKALYMSLAMVCKNEALDVVKTVTHKRGFESWRKLSKEYGASDWDVVARVHESSGIRLLNHKWIQEETV